ncbi:hypothetical protein K1I93_09640, partial [Streptococcus australis]|uniref:hypothetical protein n=1 Tax=Streptococcus australis TaxID=113107 RepID=UPI001CBAF4E4
KYTNGGGGGGRRQKRDATTTKDEGYEKKFYDILKDKYEDEGLNKFLEKLSEEQICKDPPTVGNQKADAADFTNVNTGKTFSHTEYCQACPWCGAEKDNSTNGGGWKAKNDDDCNPGKGYKDYKDTNIPILTGDKTKGDMVRKYKTFCSTGHSQIKTWQCYYDKDKKDSGQNNNCVEGTWDKFTQGKKVMS